MTFDPLLFSRFISPSSPFLSSTGSQSGTTTPSLPITFNPPSPSSSPSVHTQSGTTNNPPPSPSTPSYTINSFLAIMMEYQRGIKHDYSLYKLSEQKIGNDLFSFFFFCISFFRTIYTSVYT